MRLFLTRSSRHLLGSLLLLVATAAVANAQVGVRFEEVASGATRLDGSLRDWQGVRFIPVGGDDDGRFEFAFRYDARGFYLGASVRDERLVRNRRPSRRDDALVVTLALPSRRGLVATDLWFFPGLEGRLPGSVARGRRPRSIRGARLVEGPLPDSDSPGYVLEAFVPWSSLGRLGRGWQSGRVSVRLHDIDSETRPRPEREPAFVRVDRRALETLPEIRATGGEAAMLQRFLSSRSLEGTRPWFDRRRNTAFDRRAERVVLVDRFVLVMGAGYRNGTEFDFFELPVVSRADATSPVLVDLTGDGKAELAIRLRQHNDLGARTVWQVYRFAENGIAPLFGVEVKKETDRGFVEAELRVGRGRTPRIVVEAGRAEGLDASTFAEAPPAGVEGILLPWGSVSQRTYRWDGSQFAVADEVGSTQAQNDRNGRASSESALQTGRASLLGEYRHRVGIPVGLRAAHRLRANLAEGREPEQLAVFGMTLVVVGEHFRRGSSAFEFQVPVETAEDIVRVSSHDLTGDGREEVLLRLRRRAGDVERELLLAYQFTPGSFRRVGALETARRQGPNEVRNEVRLTRAGIEVRPGRVRGWNASSWPYADGTGDGVDPLLLPWRDRPVSYRYRSGSLRRR